MDLVCDSLNDFNRDSEPDPDISPVELARNGLSELRNGLSGEGSNEGLGRGLDLVFGLDAIRGVEWFTDGEIG